MTENMQAFDFIRSVESTINIWASSSDRKPLLIRGSRQVGKSYLVQKWAKDNISPENFLEINLEE